jgi:hypothetical protein
MVKPQNFAALHLSYLLLVLFGFYDFHIRIIRFLIEFLK